ncbi:MAG: Gfo/Idh/MocA family protein [Polyangiales bacterium]
MARLGLIGAAGFVASRHLAAMATVGSPCILACDPHDSVGVLDRHAPDARYFRDEREFFADAARARLDAIAICSPNDLHERHVVAALESGADALCEKPLALDEASLDRLSEAERRTGRRVWTVLQLRVHPAVEAIDRARGRRASVAIDYVTPRGDWYDRSWKGTPDRSGGLALNIGVHLFDLATRLFGAPARVAVRERSARTIRVDLALAQADVRVLLSVDRALADGAQPSRRFVIDEVTLDLSRLDDSLHAEIYRRTLSGRGFGIEDARAGVKLARAVQDARIER